jgi:predicted GIY-YIG superfamily endonuclease
VSFWTYILRCADDSYYTGSTDNLEQRFAQHQDGTFKGYTFKRRPARLMWSQDAGSRIEALEAEKRIKGWTRAEKEALIAGDWEMLSRLARGRSNTATRPSTSSGLTDVGQADGG